MNTAVTVIVISGMVALCAGLVMSLTTVMSLNDKLIGDSHPRRSIMMSTTPVYWSFTLWTVILGIVLMAAPKSWFGPTWHYFPQLPHNGFGMGLCLSILSLIQVVALKRAWSARVLSILFFLNGFVYWTAGIVLGAEGLLGHQGLMEAPFMLYVGAHAFAHSAALMAYRDE